MIPRILTTPCKAMIELGALIHRSDRRLRLLATGLLFATPLQAAPTVQEGGEFYIRADSIWLDGEREVKEGVVAIQDGRIRAVGRGVTVPEGAAVLEHPGVLTAGLVSCAAALGAESELYDPTRALLGEARAAHAFAPGHSDFSEALASGITTAVLAPSSRNVAGGVSAVLRTDGSVLAEEGHLTLSLRTSALHDDREPTSYPGALSALEDALASDTGVWADAAAGRLPVLIYATPRHEVARSVAFAQRHGLEGALVGAPLAGELASEIAAAELSVVLGPFGAGVDMRIMDSAVALAEAGIPFAFASAAPDPGREPLRFSAALCVRHGLDRSTAWRALTSDAARIAGVDDRVGTVAVGKAADLVLWSGDPLDLESRVQTVFVAGRRAFGGK